MYRVTAVLRANGEIKVSLYFVDRLIDIKTLYGGPSVAADEIVDWAAGHKCNRFELTITDETGHELTQTEHQPYFNQANWRTGCWTRDGHAYNSSADVFKV